MPANTKVGVSDLTRETNMNDEMKRLTRRHALAIGGGAAGALALTSFRSSAAADGTLPNSENWITLFNGKTLDGWHKNPNKIVHGTGGVWEVEPDGVLAGHQDPPGSGNGGILLTDRKFGDFELSIDMLPAWGSDSGVFLRANDLGQGIQMTVDYYDGGNIGHLYGEQIGAWVARTFSIEGTVEEGKLVALKSIEHRSPQSVGLVASCTPQEWLAAWKIGDWNTARIRVEGRPYPRVTTSINGLKVCEFDGATSDAAKYDRDEVHKLLGDDGSIVVQVHGGERWPVGAKCRWRNIKVREL
jgi:hypothetical protein